MGLCASVPCNCYETGRLLTQPPRPELVYVGEAGYLDCRNPEHYPEFYDWLENRACEHKRGQALLHYIGNIALVAFLRGELGKAGDAFPLILGKVIYDGMHGGDYLSVRDVERVRDEVARLQTLHGDSPEEEKYLREFEHQMRELVECSLKMGKPIVF